MELHQAIEKRISIRAFLEKEVNNKEIQSILLAGHQAPSGGNVQPWEFIVVRRPETKEAIVKTTFVGNNEHSPKTQAWMLTAPVFIVICADVERSTARYGKKATDSLIYLDCSAAVENMLLAVVDCNLASCYVSGFREKELISALALPTGIQPIAILPIGHPHTVPTKRKKRPLEEAVHYEYFGNLTS